jgi:RNA polymerase sigma-70 factor (ECF subfamily)
MEESVVRSRQEVDDESGLVTALRAGDEHAFAGLVDRSHTSMVRAARAYVGSKETAEDVVQDAWLGIIKGLARSEGRSSLKTRTLRIVINRAMTRGSRASRSVPFSALAHDEPTGDSSRFLDSGRWAGFWSSRPSALDVPERVLLSRETRALVDAVLAALPPNQRLVITLRDVQGFSAEETCEPRVLLRFVYRRLPPRAHGAAGPPDARTPRHRGAAALHSPSGSGSRATFRNGDQL